MKTTIQAAAAAVTLFAASAAQAQQAVQWKVSDGGNGHWYSVNRPTPYPTTISGFNSLASGQGASMACIAGPAESDFISAMLQSAGGSPGFIGLYRGGDPSTWLWSDGSGLAWSNWGGANCFNGPYPNNQHWGGEFIGIVAYRPECGWRWDDTPASSLETEGAVVVLEWSADCNDDGIVDYGQCRDGSLPDYNGNNIPDCCESGTPCVVGNYPVQWRVADGGNGHWYAALRPASPLNWLASTNLVTSRGAHLPTIHSGPENNFLLKVTLAAWTASDVTSGPFLGGRRGVSSSSSACAGWVWVTGEPFDFIAEFPSGNSFGYGPCGSVCNCMNELYGDETVLAYWGVQFPVWNSAYESTTSAVVLHEWSADCNADGIVDKGQILQGQLVDADANGVPDVCEVDPCPGDVTNGGTVDAADLSILLAAWGTNGQAEFDTDIDNSGLVDGGDLALVLGGWGPCPQ